MLLEFKSSRKYPDLISSLILFSILFAYIFIEGLLSLVFSPFCFEYLIQNKIHQVIQILHSMLELKLEFKFIFLIGFFIFFHAQYMLRFDRATYLSLHFKIILSVRLSNSLSIRIRCFIIFRIHKYCINFCIGPWLNSFYCYILF